MNSTVERLRFPALVSVGDRTIGTGSPCFVIAEAGVNHNGDLALAHRLIDVAADAGADAVKFQTFRTDRLVTASAPKAKYQQETTGAGEGQAEMLRRLELSPDSHAELQAHCADKGILFLSTPFDEESLDLLVELSVPAIKIGSGDLTNHLLLRRAARTGLPLLISTGMATLGEVDLAIRAVQAAGAGEVVLFHCVSSYPAAADDTNLRSMHTLAAAFGVPVGLSDHTVGIEVSLAAVALGAAVLEKHFTLDRALQGPDHRASLTPSELGALVRGVRLVEAALGSPVKEPMSSETDTRLIARRSLAMARDAHAGETITEAMLTALRPAGGICPSRLSLVLGRTLTRGMKASQVLEWTDLG